MNNNNIVFSEISITISRIFFQEMPVTFAACLLAVVILLTLLATTFSPQVIQNELKDCITA